MTNNDLLVIKQNHRKFYVDRLKISFILAKKYKYNIFEKSDKEIVKFLKTKGLVDANLFVRINQL